jgi:RimJ/RimL family protein N-acetyltransferase
VNFTLPDFPGGYALTTPRLTLQAPNAEDVEALWPHVTDPRITEFLAWEPHQNREETAAMIESLIQAQRAGKGFHWLVRHDGHVIGLVSLIDVRRTHRAWTWNRAELAYWITPIAQGHGFATEAAAAVMRFAFGPIGLHKLAVYHAADNPPSGRVVEKLRFRHVGDERDAFSKGGRWHDLRHYELLASEFRSSSRT